jgi:hypothetical protein
MERRWFREFVDKNWNRAKCGLGFHDESKSDLNGPGDDGLEWSMCHCGWFFYLKGDRYKFKGTP